MRCSPAWACLMILSLPLSVQASDASGFYFSHHDWELACDNTRTCRIAGYQRYQDAQAVSVLLTRQAGPQQPVTGQLKLGELDLDADEIAALRKDSRVSLVIDGQVLGEVRIDPEALAGDLSAREVSALLPALRRDSVIEWVHGDRRWRLSDTGAAAVLLKMDDFQGRVGTPGAIARTGSRSEDEVLPALPRPIVTAAPMVNEPVPESLDVKAVRATLQAGLENTDQCYGLAEPDKGGEELTIVRLSANHLLASTTCWMAAYNMGEGYWVINETPPYNPVLVTESGSYFENGTISAAHKGRGVGDCWSQDDWTWDGQQFVPTASFSTGMCRMVAAGGAWLLPTRVTEVRQASETPSP